MMRYTLLAILVLVGIPLANVANWQVGGVAVAAGAVLLTGVYRTSVRLATAGGMLALVELALAQSSGPSGLVFMGATVVGLALLYIVDDVNYVRRFASAYVDVAAQRARHRARLQKGITALATSAFLAALTSSTTAPLALPEPVRIAAGGVGAVVALLAALVGALGYRRKQKPTGGRAEM
jgi:hypothetical protein